VSTDRPSAYYCYKSSETTANETSEDLYNNNNNNNNNTWVLRGKGERQRERERKKILIYIYKSVVCVVGTVHK